MVRMKDYYQILQVHPEAGQEVLNGAYRSLVKQFHPDKYHTSRKSVMNEKMREINEAYQVLSNPVTRTEYNQRYQGHAGKFKNLPKPKTLKEQIRTVILWSLISYLVLSVVIRPLLSSPWIKLLVLMGLGFLFIRLYLKPKLPK